jgi:hypothetical protein
MTGVGLDSINKPKINAIKVFIMLSKCDWRFYCNFHFKSLIIVAVASIVFTIIGIWMGMYFLDKELSLTYKQIFSSGITFYKTMINKLTNNRYSKIIKKLN